MKRAGRFITFEGNEGCGKTTHLRRLRDRLVLEGRDVVVTREPGGTRVGDAIRKVLLDVRHAGMTPETETMLYMASRAQLAAEIIRPLLERGAIVLCDRWVDATMAYQGHGAGVDPGWIRTLARRATGGLVPDATIYLDLPVRAGLRRAGRRRALDRVERKRLAFHERVARGYRALAAAEPKRIRRIRVAEHEPAERVEAKVLAALRDVLGGGVRGR